MPKYPEEVTKIRALARQEIPKILHKKHISSTTIFKKIKSIFPEYCNDKISCTCGKSSGKLPEWRHQIRWALQDLKYHSVIDYNKKTSRYFIKKIISME